MFVQCQESHVLVKLYLWGVFGVAEVEPRTGLVFLYHCGYVFTRYPPCGWVYYVGSLCWELACLWGRAFILRVIFVFDTRLAMVVDG